MPIALEFDATADVSQALSGLGQLVPELGDVGNAATTAGTKGRGLIGGLGDMAGKAVGLLNPIGLLTSGVGFLGPKLLDAGKAAAAEQQEIDQLTNTVKNAVPAWNGNTTAIDNAIKAGQRKAFADTDLRTSLGRLVTDTGSVEEAIKLQALAMDLAAKAGIPLAQATSLVGKADDENYSALSKLGIEIVKGTSREDALALIHAKTAGAADIFADSTAGAGVRAQAAMDDALETIGGSVMPLLTTAMTGFADFMSGPIFAGAVGFLSDLLTTILTPALTFLQGLFGPIMTAAQPLVDAFKNLTTDGGGLGTVLGGLTTPFQGIGTALGGIGTTIGAVVTGFGTGGLGGAAGALTANLPGLLTSLQGIGFGIANAAVDWALGLVKWVGDAIPGLVTSLGHFGAAVFTWITSEGIPKAAEFLMQLGQKFIDFIVPALPGIVTQLTAFGSGIINWILNEGIPQAVAMLVTLGQKFVAWIGPNIPPMLAALGEIGNKLIDWVAAELPIIVQKLIEWGGALTDWIGKEVLPILPGKLFIIGQALWTWLTTTVADLITKLAPMAAALLGWVQKDVLPFLGAKLGEFATAAWTWISGTLVPAAIQNLQALGAAFIGWVGKDALPFIGGKLGEFAASIWAWITTVAVPGALAKMKEMGSALIDGIINGLRAGKDAVINFIIGIGQGALDAIKNFFGIASPSKVMADLFGLNGVAGGMVAGLDSGKRAVVAAAMGIQTGVRGALGGGVSVGGSVGAAALAGSGGAGGLSIAVYVQMPDGAYQETTQIKVVSRALQARADQQTGSYAG